MSDLRERVDEAVETLQSGLVDLTDPATRLTFTQLVLDEFLPLEDDK